MLVGTTLRRLSGGIRTKTPPGFVTDLRVTNTTVSWTLPRFVGGSPITGITVTIDGDDFPQAAGATSYSPIGLAEGDHTFSVKALNAIGAGPATTKTVNLASSSTGTAALGDGTERSAELQALIDQTPDGTAGSPVTIDLTGLEIRCDKTIQIYGRNYLTIIGTAGSNTLYTDDVTGLSKSSYYVNFPANTAVTQGDVMVRASTWYQANHTFTTGDTFNAADWDALPVATGPTHRKHWDVQDSTGITFTNVGVRGPNATGGVNGEYHDYLEGQHGFNITHSTDVTLTGCRVTQVWGDFAYVGEDNKLEDLWSDTVVIDGLYGRQNGRMGIGITAARNLTIKNCDLADMRRSLIDVEPNFTSGGVDQLTIQDNTFGAYRLSCIVFHGLESGVGYANIGFSNISITGNTFTGGFRLSVSSPTGMRSTGFTVTGNIGQGTVSGSGHALFFQQTDTISVHTNTQAVDSSSALVEVTSDCTGIDISGNTYAPGAVEWRVQAA